MQLRRRFLVPLVLLCVPVAGCGGEEADDELGEVALAGTKTQGTKTQGTKTQGTTLTSNLLYAAYAGGTNGGYPVTTLEVHNGELRGIRMRGTTPQRMSGTQLTGTYLQAMAPELPNSFQTLWIRGVSNRVGSLGYRGEDDSNTTRKYDVRVRVGSTWQPLCETDPTDRTSWAVPVAAIWNPLGDRVESSAYFTFACSSGVIAKCYGWGYRPWISTTLRDAHQACTRAARGDYCGDGRSHTMNGTDINVYDTLGVQYSAPLDRMTFEAGWTTQGARCLSHYRWEHLPIRTPEELCPHPGRKTPFPQAGDPTWPVGWNCPAGSYLDPGGMCVPAFTGYQGPAGWVCDSCDQARAIAAGLPMSLDIWECNDSRNNVFVP